MTPHPSQQFLRAIPPVDAILAHAALAGLRADHPHFPFTRLAREVLGALRDGEPASLPAAERSAITAWVAEQVRRRVEVLRRGGLRRVLNGTGVILHTNLGRAALDARAQVAARASMAGYVSLEVDLATGARSSRGEVLLRLVALATGAEAAMVVNNNAAAVYMVANTFSPPGRVIVSRGELVEIGGSFRLPEILRHAASEVVEVGTTNRTYAEDYGAAARAGDLILKVHKSNYTIEGFAHEAAIADLVAIGRAAGCAVVYDLGSGALFDFAAAGFGEEPAVAGILERGVDAVTMSGDKLMGGAQAGIIAGRRVFVERLKQNPLRRALRVDKVTIAALQEVLRAYLFDPDPATGVPAVAQILAGGDGLAERARRVVAGLSAPLPAGVAVAVCEDEAAAGGGSLTASSVPSYAISLRCASEADALALGRALRQHEPAVVPRIKGDEVRVNLRTILPGEDEDLRAALDAVLAARAGAKK
jgi:L-seryl-tRNA(Ser) seleniumtransferase